MKQAKPVWIGHGKNESNQFAGFHVKVTSEERQKGCIRIAARSYYQLYVDGQFLAAGPARCAEGYCRIDEIGVADPSGCHGFNGYVGALLTNVILGLGQPLQRTRTVKISPHPGELKWARGSALCEDGRILLGWQADHENHVLDVMLYLPGGWKARWELPFELKSWTVKVNGSILDELSDR